MRNVFVTLVIWSILTACASAETQFSVTAISTETRLLPTSGTASVTPALTEAVESAATPAPREDVFTQMGIALPAPPEACTGITQPQTEGPYYKADTPQRNSLSEAGMQGTRLILVGYVLDQNCQPLPNAWLDFWQADASGEYDNAGYRLRGHQFTDTQGRYYLETILPGLYASRPIQHIHVKVRPEGGQEITRTYLKNGRLRSKLLLGADRWISKMNNGQWLNLYFRKWNVERMAKGDREWMIERS